VFCGVNPWLKKFLDSGDTMKILVADDDSSIRKAIEYDFKEKNIEALFAQDGKQAQEIFDEIEPPITVLDIKMPKLDGMELLKYIKKKAPETKVLMISAHGTIELAVEAMKIGAEDFIVKPFSLAELSDKILRLKDIEPDILKNRNDFLGQSIAFIEHKKMLQRLAKVDSTVLLTGESGTGKEMAAKYIHQNSKRKERPFIAVNCSILSKELLSSELFGHKKGSFTGAVDNRKGKFSEAHTGTIFLDEVGEIDTDIQARLLRVIQEGEIEIVGESKPVKVDVRIIAATNRDLLDDVDNGRFREDLYYRLNVVEVKVPPLRERKEDISILTEDFIKELSIRTGSKAVRISAGAIKRLEQNIWSGNIRQLKNSIERAMIFCDTEELTEKDFDFLQKQPENQRLSSEISSDNELDVFEKNEKNTILEHMTRARNKTELAKLLGIKRTTLLYKLKKYDIEF
jgi:DNA-binding NtrC family response regulator